eukprot:m.211740 g.211740  ORF g.211740 m.211740 type:complete len:206 (-) comp18805_c0_seq1:74-691(-)
MDNSVNREAATGIRMRSRKSTGRSAGLGSNNCNMEKTWKQQKQWDHTNKNEGSKSGIYNDDSSSNNKIFSSTFCNMSCCPAAELGSIIEVVLHCSTFASPAPFQLSFHIQASLPPSRSTPYHLSRPLLLVAAASLRITTATAAVQGHLLLELLQPRCRLPRAVLLPCMHKELPVLEGHHATGKEGAKDQRIEQPTPRHVVDVALM